MKKLDWYILKKFLAVFFFAIFLFAVIAVVIDASEKTDDFVKSGLSAGEVITHYYYGFIPHIIALLFPLFVFIAVIFFTSKMAGQTEIVAIIASGVSYNRWLRPYVLGGVLLGLFLWVSNQWIIPKAEKILNKDHFGLEKVKQHNPSLIICDLMMPKLDGYVFLKKHMASSNASIPVLLLTAKTEESDELIGRNLGAKDYIKKPFSFQELKRIVAKLLLSD